MDFILKCITGSIGDLKLNLFMHTESFIQKYKQPMDKPLHSHIYYEMLYSNDDSTRLIFENKSVDLLKNHLAIIHPFFKHSTKFKSEENLYSFGFAYKPINSNDSFNFSEPLEEHLAEKAYIIIEANNFTENHFKKLKELSEENTKISEINFYAYFTTILFGIIDQLSKPRALEKIDYGVFNSVSTPSNKRIPHEIFQKIDNVLSEQYMTDITPQDLSAQFFLSAKQINRYIISQYSQTFLQRKTSLRMIAAKKYLQTGGMSISQISEKIGYNSINSFYSSFKLFFGTTPKEFIMSNK